MIMRCLPEHVPDNDIQEMFDFADKDQDGKISFTEFQVFFLESNDQLTKLVQVMINPPEPFGTRLN